MTTSLPERPDLGQLKRQAKDLLKAHAQGNPSVCPILHQLHRFAGLPDAAILASELKLHEVQFAMALGYGFSSWDAMKRHVERLPRERTAPRVHRKDGDVWIDGIPKLTWTDPGACTFIGALLRTLNRIGEPIGYVDLMGLSGAAFRFCFAHPGWDWSSVDGMLGYDHGQAAMDALGYQVSWAEEDEMRAAFVSSIEAGKPAMGIDLVKAAEWGVIAGYADEGKVLLCRTYFDDPGSEYSRTERLPWLNYMIGESRPAQPRRESFLASLQIAVTLAHADGFTSMGGGVYKRGLEGLATWAADLGDESRFEDTESLNKHVSINDFIYRSLVDARAAGARYVRDHTDVLGEAHRESLLRLASTYDQVVTALRSRKQDVPGEDGANIWTREMRERQMGTIDEVLALERQAIVICERILASH